MRGVANHIVEKTCSRIILSGIIFLTLTGCELAFKTIKKRPKMDISEQEESTFIQENLLSSNKELCEKTGELSKNHLSSKMELSKSNRVQKGTQCPK